MTIPEDRIKVLEELASTATANSETTLSQEYVRLARRIAERHRLTFPRRFERFSCDACDVYLRPGKNARVRLQNGHVVITCDCGHHHRYPYH